jgi:predicted nucleotidyltransferase
MGNGPKTSLRKLEVEGVAVRIASVEDVIVMKILAGRPKDTEDVPTFEEALERVRRTPPV